MKTRYVAHPLFEETPFLNSIAEAVQYTDFVVTIGRR